MAESSQAIPTPPLTPQLQPSTDSSPLTKTVPILTPNTSSPSDLVLQIDTLLETYLENLDQYTKLRDQLSKDLSNGFLSLAHANKNTTMGRRYGEENYDERIKAGRIVKIDSQRLHSPQEESEKKAEEPTDSAPKDDNIPSNPDFQNTHPSSSSEEPIPSFKVLSLYPPTSTSPSPSQSWQPHPKNPINQFSPLPPPPLRAAQNFFTSAVADSIPELLNVTEKMRYLEESIGALRGRVGKEGDGDGGGERKEENI